MWNPFFAPFQSRSPSSIPHAKGDVSKIFDKKKLPININHSPEVYPLYVHNRLK
jgi:hypothetical protein